MSLEVSRSDVSSVIIIKPELKPYGIATFISLIFIGFLHVFIQTIEGLVSGDTPLFLLLFLVPFFWGAASMFFNFYWAALGDEEVVINAESIKHKKIIKILRRSKRYKKSKISDIDQTDSSKNFGAAGSAMFGFSNIHVSFKYRRKNRIIGKQIEKYEAEQIIEELEHWGYTVNS